MATHTLSKKLFVGVLAISGACALAACSPVEAVPSTYNNNIIVDSEGKAIPTNDNIMGALFEAISSGKDSKVLDVIMEELVNEKYGVKATNGSGESLGYSVYTEIKSLETENDETKIKTYCNNHPDVFVREGDQEGMQVQRFKDFVKDIDKRIAKEFLSLVKESKYEDDNGMFDEQLLVDELKKDWDIKDFENGDKANKFFITADITEDNIFSNLHMYLYSYEETAEMERKIGGDTCFKEQAKGYIEKKIFPKVLKDKLVEEFILNTEARALGNASARKINYVKVPFTTDNRDYVESILSDFNKEFIYKASEVDADRANEQVDFDMINYALIGFDHLNPGHFTGTAPLINVDVNDGGSEVNDTFANNANENNTSARTYNENYYNGLSTFNKEFHKIVDVKVLESGDVKDVFKTVDGKIIFDEDFKVYGDTELGKLLEEYNKAIKAKDNFYTATEEEKSALNRFTPSTSPSMGDALKEEILTLARKDITTDGWFVKNGGASELPSSLRDRLFRLSVATNLESTETGYVEEKFVDGSENTLGAYRKDATGNVLATIPFARNINGRKFIMPSDATDFVDVTKTNTEADLIFQNDNFVKAENNSFYICQVLEAVSYAKIDPNAKTCYKVNGEVDYMRIEQTQREIAKVLSTKDTYATNAFTEYLNSYKFRFGDTSMYEYLKGQYPDLDIFDED